MTTTVARDALIGLLRDEPCPPLEPSAGWPAIVAIAIQEGLGPWLYRFLARAESLPWLPPGVAEALHEAALAAAARSLLLADELQQILRACEAAQVPCVPVRGPALAELLYGDVAARPAGDLDLIVPRGALPQVAAVLERLGFRELTHRPGFAGRFSYTLTLVKERHGWLVVEPHWTLAYPPHCERMDMAGVWRRVRFARVVGLPSRALAPEDLLLHLCLHFLHPDGGAPLLWAYELDRLVRRVGDQLDWSLFLSLAPDGVLLALVAQALDHVRSLFATPVPPAVAHRLTAARAGALREPAMRLVADPRRAHGREELATLLALPTWRLRARYLLGLLFPSREFMALQHGVRRPGALALAYAGRCLRLAARGAGALARLA